MKNNLKFPGVCFFPHLLFIFLGNTPSHTLTSTVTSTPHSIALCAVSSCSKEGFDGICKYLDKQKQQLEDMVGVVRGQLSVLQRMTMGALIVLDVHNRDVVERLVNDHCCSEKDFSWISQLRFYIRPDTQVRANAASMHSLCLFCAARACVVLCARFD